MCYVLSRFSCVRLYATPWTIACQAPLSVGFSRQEHCSGLLCPPPGDLPDPGIKPMSLAFPALAGRFFTTGTTWEALKEAYRASNLWSRVLNGKIKRVFSASSGHPDAFAQQLPNFLAPGTGFVEDSFSMDRQWAAVDGFRAILIRSTQHPSLSCAVHSRVLAPMRV